MLGIKLSQVDFAYLKKPVLTKISLTILPGSFLGITGVNGSGKTTLLYLLNGLIPHEIKGKLSGKVCLDNISTQDKPVNYWAKKIGLVFQNPDFSLFNLTVKEEISFGNPKAAVSKSLQQVGLNGYQNRDPQTLSLGEKQKICLAAVLARQTAYLALDEPTAMLDYRAALELYQLLQKLNQQGKTIIVVEHDTDFLWRFSQQTLILDQGRIKAFGKTKAVLSRTGLLNKLGIKAPQR